MERSFINAADRMAQRSGGIDAADDDFDNEYDAATGLIGEIQFLVEGLTYAPGETPSAPAPARKLGRGRNPRVKDDDSTLEPYPISTAANLIAEDLVPPDYRVRTS